MKHSLRSYIGASLTALTMYGCSGKSPVQPITNLPSTNYNNLESKVQLTDENMTPEFRAFLSKPSTNQVRSYQDMTVGKSNIKDMFSLAKIPSTTGRVTGVEQLPYDLARFSVIFEAPGYQTRETKLIGDKNASAIDGDFEMVPVDPQVRTLYDEAARTTQTGGTMRWKNPPIIYISRSAELTKGAKVTDELMKQITDLVPSAFISQFGVYAQNADIRVVDDAPWVKLNPNQSGKWPARPPVGSIVIQYNNTIPGLGGASLWDDDKDGYMDKGTVWLRTSSNMEIAIKQEVGTMFLFENFPKTMPAGSSVYLESGTALSFTTTDTKAAQWGYNRPGLNMRDDKDNGWELTWKKNSAGVLIPCEERLLLKGTMYKPIVIPGDITGSSGTLDNKVDFDDFFAFAAAFGSKEGEQLYNTLADLNLDGSIGFEDFFEFAGNFGRMRQVPNVSTKPIYNPSVAKLESIATAKDRMKALVEEANQTPNQNMRKFVGKFYKN